MPYAETFYFLVLVIVGVVILVNRRLEDSHIGRAWEAIREDELAAQAMGVPLVRTKLLAFACGASFAGVMGVVFAAKQVFINPESFTFLESIGVLAMVILGGMGSIPGAVLGATVVTVLNLQVLKGLSLWLNELKNAGVTVLRLQPGQPAHPARAGQVRAHGLRRHPGADDDLPAAGHLPGPPAPARADASRERAVRGARGHQALRRSHRRQPAWTTRSSDGISSIIGPNGAGKTTLFNVFTGLYTPEAGTVTFRGHSLVGLRPDQITALGVCRTFQNIRLFANMTAVENVLVGMHARVPLGIWDALSHRPRFHEVERGLWQRGHALLERVGLAAKANEVARNLPYGDQRRLELARALASEPALLLLDEPTAGMTQGEAQPADGPAPAAGRRSRSRDPADRAQHARRDGGVRPGDRAGPRREDRRGPARVRSRATPGSSRRTWAGAAPRGAASAAP